MLYKRLTVNEFNNKFMLTIVECISCKYWIQNLDLLVEKMQSVKNLDFNYANSDLFFLPEDISKKFMSGKDFSEYKNMVDEKNDIIDSLIDDTKVDFPSYAKYWDSFYFHAIREISKIFNLQIHT